MCSRPRACSRRWSTRKPAKVVSATGILENFEIFRETSKPENFEKPKFCRCSHRSLKIFPENSCCCNDTDLRGRGDDVVDENQLRGAVGEHNHQAADARDEGRCDVVNEDIRRETARHLLAHLDESIVLVDDFLELHEESIVMLCREVPD